MHQRENAALTISPSRWAGTRDVCRSIPGCQGRPTAFGLHWRTEFQMSSPSRSQSVSPACRSPVNV